MQAVILIISATFHVAAHCTWSLEDATSRDRSAQCMEALPSAVLMQYDVKQRKTVAQLSAEEAELAQTRRRKRADVESHPGGEENGSKAPAEPYRYDRLKWLLDRARANSRKSGAPPLDYAMDVDYLHDANNPLEDIVSSPGDSPGGPGASSGRRRPWTWSGEKEEYQAPVPPTDSKTFSEDVGCTTVETSSATLSIFSSDTVSKPGTPCVFGADVRDEGYHCIMDAGKHGLYGWCYTTKDGSTWGSCSEYCPLSGQAGILERRIDAMDKLVAKVLAKVRGINDSVYASGTPAQNSDAPSEAEDIVRDNPKDAEEKSAKPGKSEKTEASEPEELLYSSLGQDWAQAENSNKVERKDRSGIALVSKGVQLAQILKRASSASKNSKI